MCIYFVRDCDNAAEAISFMLRSNIDKTNLDARRQVDKQTCHFIRCQKTEQCVSAVLMVH